MTRVVLAPPVLAFLPEYAGVDDPLADLRSVVLAAVGRLGADVTVLGDPQAQRVAAHLLACAPRTGGEPSYLVMGNGSARRTDSSPGPYDERAVPYDDAVRDWLLADGPEPDWSLGPELWAATDAISHIVRLSNNVAAQVDYDDAPLGVQYWVVRWSSGSPTRSSPHREALEEKFVVE